MLVAYCIITPDVNHLFVIGGAGTIPLRQRTGRSLPQKADLGYSLARFVDQCRTHLLHCSLASPGAWA